MLGIGLDTGTQAPADARFLTPAASSVAMAVGVRYSGVVRGVPRPALKLCSLRAYSEQRTDYGIPQPPYGSSSRRQGGAAHQESPAKPQGRRSWEYGAPAKYTSPGDYTVPKPYKAPGAYGPGQASGGGDSGNSGGRGRGGGGGGGGFGGNTPKFIALLFAILVAVGGYMGYRKKGSTASLKASGAVATVLLIAGILTGGRFNRAGLILALVANLALGGYMLKGWWNTHKVFPQAVFALISAVNSLIYVNALTRA